MSNRVINEFDCVARVAYNITGKPSGNIEWG